MFCSSAMLLIKHREAFIDSVFPPDCPGIEPQFLFFDNACGLRSYLTNRQEFSLLKRMGIIVDSFHFAGHKKTHTECQENCNPKAFPLLTLPDGGWLFNTSAAEQINSWFGKFQPKVKEMNVIRSLSPGPVISGLTSMLHRYNFYLDEVINVHNEVREVSLRKRGMNPEMLTPEEIITVNVLPSP